MCPTTSINPTTAKLAASTTVRTPAFRNLGPVPAKALQFTRGQATFTLDDANLVVQNLDAGGLRAPGLNQFAFIMQPVKLQGGTGSTVSPVAVR